ncbi:MAG TPA: riboflavin biosynthesis protein RibF [Phycisphaerales bacterium]|nr:riboflavin biosynthesis protein RibF [Phycisphaerales bacterium]
MIHIFIDRTIDYPYQAMPKGPVITIGNFDGVHLGHQAILLRASKLAKSLGTSLQVITFDPPPAHLIRPNLPMQSLSSIQERVQKLQKNGADDVVVIHPTPDWLHQSPQTFIQKLLENHHMIGMVEGDDFRFGADRLGDVSMLQSLGNDLGFATEIVPPVEVLLNDQLISRVSSTLTRWLLTHGRVADVARCLGHAYELKATVIHGEKRGRTINVPTVNLELDELGGRALPAEGVYGGYALLEDGSRHPAAISLGLKPTFNGHVQTLEAHLLDFTGDLYDQQVCLSFNRWVRHQQPFPSFSDLRVQLDRDIFRIKYWAQRGSLIIDSSEKAVPIHEV